LQVYRLPLPHPSLPASVPLSESGASSSPLTDSLFFLISFSYSLVSFTYFLFSVTYFHFFSCSDPTGLSSLLPSPFYFPPFLLCTMNLAEKLAMSPLLPFLFIVRLQLLSSTTLACKSQYVKTSGYPCITLHCMAMQLISSLYRIYNQKDSSHAHTNYV